MGEPTTPTGKRLHAGLCDFYEPHGCIHKDGIKAIEDEAREQGRALADELGKALRGVRVYDGSGMHPNGMNGGRVECWNEWGGDDCDHDPCIAARAALAKWEASR